MIGVLKSMVCRAVGGSTGGTRPQSDRRHAVPGSLYRDAAGRAGITYVDVWDGFVDEAGRYVQQGPDFEGQIAGCALTTTCTSPRPAP